VTDEEFDNFLADALEELQAKQSALTAKYRLGEHGRFVVDLEQGVLTFFQNERPTVEAEIVPLATHVPDKSSLKWAWADEQYPPAVRQEASGARCLHGITGFELFTNEFVECDEAMAWEFAALACKVLGKAGAYRIPNRNLYNYVLINEIKWWNQG
jgi:Family of unknown function (DUF6882)